MTNISLAGTPNTTALAVPDLYVIIQPPGLLSLNGVPSNTLGVIGTAVWGPVNQPVSFGSYAQFSQSFGALQARKYDLGTPVGVAVVQGASSFVGVRVTDGTDTAAGAVSVNYTTLFALYSGSLGNQMTLVYSAGAMPNTMSVTVYLPGIGVESYPNLPATSGNVFWAAFVKATSTGLGAANGVPSALVVVGANTAQTLVLPTAGTVTFSGGSDGATNVTQNTLIGVDGTARTGMYALRGQGCSVAMLADCDLSTTYSTQVSFGISEGVYMILTGPSGQTITAAVSAAQSSGVANAWAKLMMGDWLAWADPVNQITRFVSPQGFIAGLLVNLSPQNSSLNKQIFGISYSQKTGSGLQSGAYSQSDLQTLIQAGIDVIAIPSPGGSYWAAQSGHNSSLNPAVYSDAYTRLTNYIAQTLSAGMGVYVGEVINSTLLQNITSTLLGYLGNLLQQGLLGSLTGAVPYAVVCNSSNNPQSRTSLGYVQADVQIQYQGINEKFIVNLQGGAGVTISSASQQSSNLGGVAAV